MSKEIEYLLQHEEDEVKIDFEPEHYKVPVDNWKEAVLKWYCNYPEVQDAKTN